MKVFPSNTLLKNSAHSARGAAERRSECCGGRFAPIGSYRTLVESENAVVVNNANTAQVFGDRKAELQSLFTEIKANPGCTAGMAKDMGLVTTSSKPAPADMQPTTHAVWWLFRRTRVYPHPNSRSRACHRRAAAGRRRAPRPPPPAGLIP
jgi:hypothetical protein